MNGGKSLKCFGDSGASRTTISSEMIKHCGEIKIKKLKKKILVSLANEQKVEIEDELVTTLEIGKREKKTF